MSQISEIVIQAIATILKILPEDIQLTQRFQEDLGADSLDTVELAMALEKEFAIAITDAEAVAVLTVQHVIDFVVQETNKNLPSNAAVAEQV